ncbi:hypothetical protein [Mesorhizobium sp. J428]|uniref:hypothetical protein n=1 Tax=Mesorhizobium sp. J428 TaxID=2898440 RepID=UPI0021519449|nr:hypothetical protein [Mesorhizobium sp. J428]MCR5858280.1 hypothetical protein [Mesorhizobium sp. J428]
MATHNDIYRVARDPNYRILYEGERIQETFARTAPEVQNEIDRKQKEEDRGKYQKQEKEDRPPTRTPR